MIRSSKTDLIIHPVRLRILAAFASSEHLTAHQISTRLPDVPQATLYRHLRTLLQGDVLTVVDHRPVRAADQKIYAVADHSTNVGPTDYRVRHSADHLRYFTTFLGVVRGDFQRYLEQHPRADLARDGVAYYHIPLHLTDLEHRRLVAGLKALLRPLREQGPTAGRRRRLLTVITMPGMVEPQAPLVYSRRANRARANGE